MPIYNTRRIVAKTDLSIVMKFVRLFDSLKQDKNYTLRDIARFARVLYLRGLELDSIVSSLKNVNDKLHLLKRADSLSVKDFPDKIGCYLYIKRMDSSGVRKALTDYNDAHYKTRLTSYSAPVRTQNIFEIASLETKLKDFSSQNSTK